MDIPFHLRPYVRRSTEEDAYILAPNLREDDLNDIKNLTDHNPLECLIYGIKNSEICVTFHMGWLPVGMGGITKQGKIWALFHRNFLKTKEQRQIFLKLCPQVLKWWLSLTSFYYVNNVTQKKNKKILRWLKWLGAKFTEYTHSPNLVYFHFAKEGGQSK